MAIRADEDVLRLEVAVDDARGVQAFDALDLSGDARHVVLGVSTRREGAGPIVWRWDRQATSGEDK